MVNVEVNDTHEEPSPVREAISRMTATVDIADIERELDAEKAAKKGTVILDYEAMLAALDALLGEMRKRDGRARHRATSLIRSMARNQRPSNPTHGSKRTPCSPRNSPAAAITQGWFSDADRHPPTLRPM